MPTFNCLSLLIRHCKPQPRIMSRRGAAYCALTSVILLITLLTWTNYLRSDTPVISAPIPSTYFNMRKTISSSLRLQDPMSLANDTILNCVTAKLDRMEFPMCTYSDKDDIYISRVVLRGSYYESAFVLRTLNFMNNHDDVTFLDIGANLGSYALPVAHAGGHVVAVEPNWSTLRLLSKSVYLGRISNNIDLLHYAIAEKRFTTFMKYNPVNRGRAEMADEASCKTDCVNVSVSVITLDDILPIMRNKKVIVKVDVEGAEINVFTSSSADEFFRRIDVLIIQMEWSFYPMYFSQTLEKRQLVDKFLNFFYQKDFVIYNAKTEQRLHSNWTKWPNDICIRKFKKGSRLYDL